MQEEIEPTQSAHSLRASDDDDSPDQLSEIDRMEELMGKLSAKNKQIKRLLQDIEARIQLIYLQSKNFNLFSQHLEEQTSLHVNVIKALKGNVDESEGKIAILCNNFEETHGQMLLLEQKISHLNLQLHQQMQENRQLTESRHHDQMEFERFSHELEERVRYYKSIMDEKQEEFNEVKNKYESFVDKIPGIDIESNESEIRQLIESIKSRDEVIAELQEKIQLVSSELVEATEIISNMNEEKIKVKKICSFQFFF